MKLKKQFTIKKMIIFATILEAKAFESRRTFDKERF